jgi:16S rRNA (adenine1518-N6/adenine1519-N6)-dimethyltransferase
MTRPKKSLGQHWLTDQTARATIIATANLKAGETALEIGPGEGFLTTALLETGARVIAVEKDDRLIDFLQTKFTDAIKNRRLTLIHDDIMKVQSSKLKIKNNNYKLIANIPYYLTGQIIRQFLTAANQPETMTLMLQKEVAQRIVAKDGKESLLSISVKCYGLPHYIRTVPRGAFRPTPKVDSAILQIDNISRDRFIKNKITETEFFALLHRGFAAKRKMLRAKLGLTNEELASCGVASTARAENLTTDQWFCLAKQKSVPRP